MTTKVTGDVILSNSFLIALLVKEIPLQISNFGFYFILYQIKEALYIKLAALQMPLIAFMWIHPNDILSQKT